MRADLPSGLDGVARYDRKAAKALREGVQPTGRILPGTAAKVARSLGMGVSRATAMEGGLEYRAQLAELVKLARAGGA